MTPHVLQYGLSTTVLFIDMAVLAVPTYMTPADFITYIPLPKKGHTSDCSSEREFFRSAVI